MKLSRGRRWKLSPIHTNRSRVTGRESQNEHTMKEEITTTSVNTGTESDSNKRKKTSNLSQRRGKKQKTLI